MKFIRKYFLIFLITGLCGFSAWAQFHNPAGSGNFHYLPIKRPHNKLSPGARMLIHDLDKQNNNSGRLLPGSNPLKTYPFYTLGNVTYIGALAKVNHDIDQSLLDSLGVVTGSKINNIWSLKIPVNHLADFSDVPGIEYLETDHKVVFKLDSARKTTRVDSVQQGIFLPHGYDGTGVIVGIIDGGFDYTHPTFYDTTGTTLRIKRVWDQLGTGGTPPAGFGYGNELTNVNNILTAETSEPGESHGTHVAGIAAGSGFGTNGKYRGMAPGADLVFVQYGNTLTNIQDGIAYISNYAQSVHEPAVINLSLGSHLGPHDGTSLFDQAVDLFSDNVIIVGAAGNEGDTPLHLSHTFSNDTIQTIVTFESTSGLLYKSSNGEIDIWGTANASFSVSAKLYNLAGSAVDSSAYISTSSNSVTDISLAGGNVHLVFTADSSNTFNNKPEMLLSLTAGNSSSYSYITLKIAGTSGTVHAWNDGQGIGAPFTNKTPLSTAITAWLAGDVNYTVGEIGGTANRILTAGAYVTKDRYTDLAGDPVTNFSYLSVGDLTPYSSHGPTADGRLKPEISAPGALIVSSLNSFDNTYGPNSTTVVDQVILGNKTWYFGAFQGTSMATPMVTGIVALMLQANPLLTPEQIKDTLRVTSISDDKTGSIPPAGSNSWGWGKINAYKALNSLITGKPATPAITISGNLDFCPGGHVTLSGPDGFRYWWSTGDTVQQITLGMTANVTLRIGIPDGAWSDPSSPVFVHVLEPPVLEIQSLGPTTFCDGDSVALFVKENIAASYKWYKDLNLLPDTDTSITVKSAGIYFVQTNDPGICTATSGSISVTVDTIPAKPVITNSSNLLRSDALTGNQWYYNYEIILGATIDSIQAIKSGYYYVRTGSGCFINSDTLQVTTRPVISVTGEPEFCKGDSVMLSGPAGYAIKWISGDTSQQIIARQTGIYAFNITDQYGLTSDNSDTVSVVVHDPHAVNLIHSGPLDFCDGDSVVIIASGDPSCNYKWFHDDSLLNASDSILVVKVSGDYSFLAIDTNQCRTYSDTLRIEINPVPPKPSISVDNNFLITDALDGLHWYFNNDTIAGAVNDTLIINNPGNYMVMVTSDSGCYSASDTINISVLGFENTGIKNLLVYPNPAHDRLEIKSLLTGPAEIRIAGLSGIVIFSVKMNLTGMDAINLAGLSPGYYLLMISAGDKNHMVKFIKK